jgi:hypothetical protein
MRVRARQMDPARKKDTLPNWEILGGDPADPNSDYPEALGELVASDPMQMKQWYAPRSAARRGWCKRRGRVPCVSSPRNRRSL